MDCHHFDAGRCRSCTWLSTPYEQQVAQLDARARDLLAPLVDPSIRWEPPVTGPESGFRNKAKMVVAGTVEQPTLGILDPVGGGVDLRDCGLHEPAIQAALPTLADLVTRAGLTPYDVPARRGELKHLLVTASPDGELMVRFVLRSTEPLARLRKHLPWLLDRLPIAVASVNLQPEHKAVLEGEEEIVLTERDSLPMRLGPVTLQLRPRSFFQTNTAIAERLYATARAWTDDIEVGSVLDLYCGVGGFALTLAAPGRRVHGVEVSADAVRAAEAARAAAHAAGIPGTSPEEVGFTAGDATATAGAAPDLLVVNPPRRGLGERLCAWIEEAAPAWLLYSSCRPETLARDLGDLPGYEPVRVQLFDMFPQTEHAEVLVLARRRGRGRFGA
ncbi:23S rRNA (uracil(747)-C(5))-methyltransferase RlmC [Nocardioides fonticola]|uniref:23S rRNA (Uracil(747)-C(5))-methyltransferase RlmC n=1 Tax=Nocardioides fonticola TaxID=450363 RepID=A0ABP7XJT3_9ACTN